MTGSLRRLLVPRSASFLSSSVLPDPVIHSTPVAYMRNRTTAETFFRRPLSVHSKTPSSVRDAPETFFLLCRHVAKKECPHSKSTISTYGVSTSSVPFSSSLSFPLQRLSSSTSSPFHFSPYVTHSTHEHSISTLSCTNVLAQILSPSSSSVSLSLRFSHSTPTSTLHRTTPPGSLKSPRLKVGNHTTATGLHEHFERCDCFLDTPRPPPPPRIKDRPSFGSSSGFSASYSSSSFLFHAACVLVTLQLLVNLAVAKGKDEEQAIPRTFRGSVLCLFPRVRCTINSPEGETVAPRPKEHLSSSGFRTFEDIHLASRATLEEETRAPTLSTARRTQGSACGMSPLKRSDFTDWNLLTSSSSSFSKLESSHEKDKTETKKTRLLLISYPPPYLPDDSIEDKTRTACPVCPSRSISAGVKTSSCQKNTNGSAPPFSSEIAPETRSYSTLHLLQLYSAQPFSLRGRAACASTSSTQPPSSSFSPSVSSGATSSSSFPLPLSASPSLPERNEPSDNGASPVITPGSSVSREKRSFSSSPLSSARTTADRVPHKGSLSACSQDAAVIAKLASHLPPFPRLIRRLWRELGRTDSSVNNNADLSVLLLLRKKKKNGKKGDDGKKDTEEVAGHERFEASSEKEKRCVESEQAAFILLTFLMIQNRHWAEEVFRQCPSLSAMHTFLSHLINSSIPPQDISSSNTTSSSSFFHFFRYFSQPSSSSSVEASSSPFSIEIITEAIRVLAYFLFLPLDQTLLHPAYLPSCFSFSEAHSCACSGARAFLSPSSTSVRLHERDDFSNNTFDEVKKTSSLSSARHSHHSNRGLPTLPPLLVSSRNLSDNSVGEDFKADETLVTRLTFSRWLTNLAIPHSTEESLHLHHTNDHEGQTERGLPSYLSSLEKTPKESIVRTSGEGGHQGERGAKQAVVGNDCRTRSSAGNEGRLSLRHDDDQDESLSISSSRTVLSEKEKEDYEREKSAIRRLDPVSPDKEIDVLTLWLNGSSIISSSSRASGLAKTSFLKDVSTSSLPSALTCRQAIIELRRFLALLFIRTAFTISHSPDGEAIEADRFSSSSSSFSCRVPYSLSSSLSSSFPSERSPEGHSEKVMQMLEGERRYGGGAAPQNSSQDPLVNSEVESLGIPHVKTKLFIVLLKQTSNVSTWTVSSQRVWLDTLRLAVAQGHLESLGGDTRRHQVQRLDILSLLFLPAKQLFSFCSPSTSHGIAKENNTTLQSSSGENDTSKRTALARLFSFSLFSSSTASSFLHELVLTIQSLATVSPLSAGACLITLLRAVKSLASGEAFGTTSSPTTAQLEPSLSPFSSSSSSSSKSLSSLSQADTVVSPTSVSTVDSSSSSWLRFIPWYSSASSSSSSSMNSEKASSSLQTLTPGEDTSLLSMPSLTYPIYIPLIPAFLFFLVSWSLDVLSNSFVTCRERELRGGEGEQEESPHKSKQIATDVNHGGSQEGVLHSFLVFLRLAKPGRDEENSTLKEKVGDAEEEYHLPEWMKETSSLADVLRHQISTDSHKRRDSNFSSKRHLSILPYTSLENDFFSGDPLLIQRMDSLQKWVKERQSKEVPTGLSDQVLGSRLVLLLSALVCEVIGSYPWVTSPLHAELVDTSATHHRHGNSIPFHEGHPAGMSQIQLHASSPPPPSTTLASSSMVAQVPVHQSSLPLGLNKPAGKAAALTAAETSLAAVLSAKDVSGFHSFLIHGFFDPEEGEDTETGLSEGSAGRALIRFALLAGVLRHHELQMSRRHSRSDRTGEERKKELSRLSCQDLSSMHTPEEDERRRRSRRRTGDLLGDFELKGEKSGERTVDGERSGQWFSDYKKEEDSSNAKIGPQQAEEEEQGWMQDLGDWTEPIRHAMRVWMASQNLSSRHFTSWLEEMVAGALYDMQLQLLEDLIERPAKRAAGTFFDWDVDTILAQTLALLEPPRPPSSVLPSSPSFKPSISSLRSLSTLTDSSSSSSLGTSNADRGASTPSSSSSVSSNIPKDVPAGGIGDTSTSERNMEKISGPSPETLVVRNVHHSSVESGRRKNNEGDQQVEKKTVDLFPNLASSPLREDVVSNNREDQERAEDKKVRVDSPNSPPVSSPVRLPLRVPSARTPGDSRGQERDLEGWSSTYPGLQSKRQGHLENSSIHQEKNNTEINHSTLTENRENGETDDSSFLFTRLSRDRELQVGDGSVSPDEELRRNEQAKVLERARESRFLKEISSKESTSHSSEEENESSRTSLRSHDRDKMGVNEDESIDALSTPTNINKTLDEDAVKRQEEEMKKKIPSKTSSKPPVKSSWWSFSFFSTQDQETDKLSPLSKSGRSSVDPRDLKSEDSSSSSSSTALPSVNEEDDSFLMNSGDTKRGRDSPSSSSSSRERGKGQGASTASVGGVDTPHVLSRTVASVGPPKQIYVTDGEEFVVARKTRDFIASGDLQVARSKSNNSSMETSLDRSGMSDAGKGKPRSSLFSFSLTSKQLETSETPSLLDRDETESEERRRIKKASDVLNHKGDNDGSDGNVSRLRGEDESQQGSGGNPKETKKGRLGNRGGGGGGAEESEKLEKKGKVFEKEDEGRRQKGTLKLQEEEENGGSGESSSMHSKDGEGEDSRFLSSSGTSVGDFPYHETSRVLPCKSIRKRRSTIVSLPLIWNHIQNGLYLETEETVPLPNESRASTMESLLNTHDRRAASEQLALLSCCTAAFPQECLWLSGGFDVLLLLTAKTFDFLMRDPAALQLYASPNISRQEKIEKVKHVSHRTDTGKLHGNDSQVPNLSNKGKRTDVISSSAERSASISIKREDEKPQSKYEKKKGEQQREEKKEKDDEDQKKRKKKDGGDAAKIAILEKIRKERAELWKEIQWNLRTIANSAAAPDSSLLSSSRSRIAWEQLLLQIIHEVYVHPALLSPLFADMRQQLPKYSLRLSAPSIVYYEAVRGLHNLHLSIPNEILSLSNSTKKDSSSLFSSSLHPVYLSCVYPFSLPDDSHMILDPLLLLPPPHTPVCRTPTSSFSVSSSSSSSNEHACGSFSKRLSCFLTENTSREGRTSWLLLPPPLLCSYEVSSEAFEKERDSFASFFFSPRHKDDDMVIIPHFPTEHITSSQLRSLLFALHGNRSPGGEIARPTASIDDSRHREEKRRRLQVSSEELGDHRRDSSRYPAQNQGKYHRTYEDRSNGGGEREEEEQQHETTKEKRRRETFGHTGSDHRDRDRRSRRSGSQRESLEEKGMREENEGSYGVASSCGCPAGCPCCFYFCADRALRTHQLLKNEREKKSHGRDRRALERRAGKERPHQGQNGVQGKMSGQKKKRDDEDERSNHETSARLPAHTEDPEERRGGLTGLEEEEKKKEDDVWIRSKDLPLSVHKAGQEENVSEKELKDWISRQSNEEDREKTRHVLGDHLLFQDPRGEWMIKEKEERNKESARRKEDSLPEFEPLQQRDHGLREWKMVPEEREERKNDTHPHVVDEEERNKNVTEEEEDEEDEKEVKADKAPFVIFLHGLRGSAWRTWRCSRCHDEVILLPEDAERAFQGMSKVGGRKQRKNNKVTQTSEEENEKEARKDGDKMRVMYGTDEDLLRLGGSTPTRIEEGIGEKTLGTSLLSEKTLSYIFPAYWSYRFYPSILLLKLPSISVYPTWLFSPSSSSFSSTSSPSRYSSLPSPSETGVESSVSSLVTSRQEQDPSLTMPLFSPSSISPSSSSSPSDQQVSPISREDSSRRASLEGRDRESRSSRFPVDDCGEDSMIEKTSSEEKEKDASVFSLLLLPSTFCSCQWNESNGREAGTKEGSNLLEEKQMQSFEMYFYLWPRHLFASLFPHSHILAIDYPAPLFREQPLFCRHPAVTRQEVKEEEEEELGCFGDDISSASPSGANGRALLEAELQKSGTTLKNSLSPSTRDVSCVCTPENIQQASYTEPNVAASLSSRPPRLSPQDGWLAKSLSKDANDPETYAGEDSQSRRDSVKSSYDHISSPSSLHSSKVLSSSSDTRSWNTPNSPSATLSTTASSLSSQSRPSSSRLGSSTGEGKGSVYDSEGSDSLLEVLSSREGVKLQQIGKCALQQLQAAGVGGTDRPIVFVAHSMGGLLAQYLILHDEGIRRNTRAVLFYGTPLQGSPLAEGEWVRVARSFLPRYVLQLSPADSYRRSLTGAFRHLLQTPAGRHIRVAALGEMQVTKLPYIGRSSLIVPPWSSLPSWLPARPRLLVDVDHTHICKPSTAEDVRFKVLAELLAEVEDG